MSFVIQSFPARIDWLCLSDVVRASHRKEKSFCSLISIIERQFEPNNDLRISIDGLDSPRRIQKIEVEADRELTVAELNSQPLKA